MTEVSLLSVLTTGAAGPTARDVTREHEETAPAAEDAFTAFFSVQNDSAAAQTSGGDAGAPRGLDPKDKAGSDLQSLDFLVIAPPLGQPAPRQDTRDVPRALVEAAPLGAGGALWQPMSDRPDVSEPVVGAVSGAGAQMGLPSSPEIGAAVNVPFPFELTAHLQAQPSSLLEMAVRSFDVAVPVPSEAGLHRSRAESPEGAVPSVVMEGQEGRLETALTAARAAGAEDLLGRVDALERAVPGRPFGASAVPALAPLASQVDATELRPRQPVAALPIGPLEALETPSILPSVSGGGSLAAVVAPIASVMEHRLRHSAQPFEAAPLTGAIEAQALSPHTPSRPMFAVADLAVRAARSDLSATPVAPEAAVLSEDSFDGFGWRLAGHGGIEAASEAATSLPSARAVSVPQQVVQAVIARQTDITDIRLSPEELGHVRIHLRKEGETMFVVIQAERSETLDLMRRHVDSLADDLRDAGFGALEFGFAEGWTAAEGEDQDLPGPQMGGADLAPTDRGRTSPAPMRQVVSLHSLDVRL